MLLRTYSDPHPSATVRINKVVLDEAKQKPERTVYLFLGFHPTYETAQWRVGFHTRALEKRALRCNLTQHFRIHLRNFYKCLCCPVWLAAALLPLL